MLNVVALNGRLTSDAELKHTSSGIAVTTFTLAVDRSYQKQGEDRQADFINIVCWRNTAEFVAKYFHKGQLVAVEGSLQTRTYTDRDGNKRKAVEVVASHAHFAESKRDSYESATQQNFSDAQKISTGSNCDFMNSSEDELPF